MKASLRSVRIAPKKANLIAKMVRGLSVQEALTSLERTNKKAARLLEDLIKSAVANAQHNDKQDPETLVIKSLIVNQAQAYLRGFPIARGRWRPIRKFLSHISVTLGVHEEAQESKETRETEESKEREAPAKEPQAASQTATKAVKKQSPASAKASAGQKVQKKTTSTAPAKKDSASGPSPSSTT